MINSTKTQKSLLFIIILTVLVIPFISFAQNIVPPPVDVDNGGLVPCGNELWPKGTIQNINGKNVDVSLQIKNPCGFGHILGVINGTIHFILWDLVIPIAAIMFTYCGFMLLTSGGNPDKKTKAKKIFMDVAFGFAIAVASWLIIRTVLSILGYNGTWIGF